MKKTTVFVQMEESGKKTTVAKAIEQVAHTFGAEIVNQAVDADDVESDIAVVDRVDSALKIIKETEKTAILLAFMPMTDKKREVEAFAARFPDRVKAVDMVLASNGPPLVPMLLKLIAEKAEVQP